VRLARLAEQPDGDRVTVFPAGASDVPLPERIAAVAGLHMIGHLAPAERRSLFAAVAVRLAPGAPVVLNVQAPDTAVEVLEFPPFGVSLGRCATWAPGARRPPDPTTSAGR